MICIAFQEYEVTFYNGADANGHREATAYLESMW